MCHVEPAGGSYTNEHVNPVQSYLLRNLSIPTHKIVFTKTFQLCILVETLNSAVIVLSYTLQQPKFSLLCVYLTLGFEEVAVIGTRREALTGKRRIQMS